MKTIYKTKTATIQVKKVGTYYSFNLIYRDCQLSDVRYKEGEGFFYHSMDIISKGLKEVMKQYVEFAEIYGEDYIVRRADIKKGMTFNKIGSKGNVQSKLLIVDKYNYCQSSKKYCSINYNDINDYQEIDGNKLVYTEEFL